jgi:hypothetical protein
MLDRKRREMGVSGQVACGTQWNQKIAQHGRVPFRWMDDG